MERFFLCCFRSCLKGDNDKEYYEVLELDSHATSEQIKKQYKKLSLTLHPDKLAQRGIEVTPDHKHRFLKLKEAYDTLSDSKKRRLYDEYGPFGIKIIENPTEINHLDLLRNFQKNRGDRTSLALLIALIFACILLLPILFSLKCDGTLKDSAPWVAIWSPMWFVDLFLIFTSVYVFFDPEDDDEDQHDADDAGAEEKKPKREKIPLVEKCTNLITTLLFILLQIFITMRLDDYISWSWFVVFVPWFVYEGVGVLYNLNLAYVTQIVKPDMNTINQQVEEGLGEEDKFMLYLTLEGKYFEKLMEKSRARKSILIHLLRAWLAVFLALKVDHEVDWNWGLVLLPIWIYLFAQYVYAMLYRCWGSSKLAGLDAEAIMAGEETDPEKLARFQQGNDLMSNSFFLCFAQAIPLFMAIMLVCRLQESDYSTFWIILPVFVIIGCCCCVIFCGLLCLSVVDTDGLEQEMNGGASGAGGEKKAGDEEAGYSPPVVVVMEPNPSAQQPTVISAEYGTFPEPSSSQQSPLLENAEENKSDSSASRLLPVTGIDADID